LNKLIFKVFINGSKWKSIRLNSNNITLDQAYKKIKESKSDFIFIDVRNNEDITYKFLLSIIKSNEDIKSKFITNTDILYRIIRGNGLIEYTETLSSKELLPQ
jgi:polyhydroxyalkanoate synthesis regulator protein